MQARLRFLGAARNVTGSRHMLEVEDTRILVDCGLYQERQFVSRNWDPFDVPPASIKAVLLTHAHLDHCGLLPKLVKEGFNGRIYCTGATAEIAKIVLLDAAKIQEEDAAYKQKRHKKEGRAGPHGDQPLYTAEDAETVLPALCPDRVRRNGEGCAGRGGRVLRGRPRPGLVVHQRGDLAERRRPQRVVLGRRRPARTARSSAIRTAPRTGITSWSNPPTATASTAAARTSRPPSARSFARPAHAGGNLIVPSFALERAQELLYFIHELQHEDAIPHIMVFLDSPMASAITKVFRHHPDLFDGGMRRLMQKHESPFEFPGLKFTESTKESKAINTIKGTVVVIAGSGMCTAGRIKHHLANNITRPESTIMFVGYQAIGTLGRRIVDGDPEVRILGVNYPVKARVVQIQGFSAHADKEELLQWLGSLKKPPRKLFVVHGEAESAKHFGQFIRERTGWEVAVPEYQEEAVLS